MLFRYKMESNICSPCFHCDSKGRPGTAFRSFHTHSLKVSSLSDSHISGYTEIQKNYYHFKEKYIRHPGANPKKVPHVLSNGNELIAEIKARFKTANVTVVYIFRTRPNGPDQTEGIKFIPPDGTRYIFTQS